MKYYYIVILSIFIPLCTQAQQINYTLAEPFSGTQDYVARDYIEMTPGFSYEATSGIYFSASLDENLICDVVYDDLLDNADLTIDKTLAVGTTAGSFNVSAGGGATYQVPIKVAPGTRGMQPKLSVVYNSQAGNGLLGMGWNLSGISAITRIPKTIEQDGTVVGVDLSSTDRFALNGNRLNVTNGGTYGADATIYGTEMETFVEVTSFGGSTSDGPARFKVKTSDGHVIEYGNGNGSCYTLSGKNVYWKINKITDQAENYMTYHYDIIEGEHVITEIKYTGNSTSLDPYNSIKFFYEERTDNNILYIGGKAIEQNLLLRKIRLTADGDYVRSYEFKYGSNNMYSFLNEIVETGADNTHFNATKIQYNGTSSEYPGGFLNVSTTTESVAEAEKIVGDFNGDGRQDYIYNYVTSYIMYLSNGDFTFQSIYPSSSVSKVNNGICVHDYNGDGIDEFYLIKQSDNKAQLYKLSGNEIDGYNIVSANQAQIQLTLGYTLHSFDVDGNGKPNEVIINNNGHIDDILGISYTTPPNITLADKKFFNDFNGNGKVDFFYRNENVVNIYEYNGSGGFDLIAETTLYFEDDETPAFELFGDFNGDGKQDYLYDIDNALFVYSFTGNIFAPRNDFLFDSYSETCVGHSFEEIFCDDFNGDGKDDVIKYFSNDRANIYIYYSNGNGFLNPVEYSSGLPVLIGAEKMDMNGDGKMDLYSKFTGGGFETILSIKPASHNLFVSSITNGVGNTTNIVYNSIAENGSNYSKGTASASFPVIVFQEPLYVVKSIETQDGAGGTAISNYTFEGARAHLQGKGFLGFKIVISENTSSNINTETTQTWESSSSYFTDNTITTIEKDAILLSETTTSFSKNTINGTLGYKRYFQYPETITELNGLTNTTTTITFSYVNNWLDTKTTQYSGGTTEEVETHYTYTDLSTSEFNLKIPTTITNTRTLDGETFTITTTLSSFNSDKFPQTINVNDVSTTYDYDVFGNVISKSLTIDGNNRTEGFGYDNKGRFLANKQTNDYIEYFGFNSLGNLTSKKAINGLNTQYSYDGFGRLVHTESPDGNIYTTEYKWDNNAGDNIEYYTHSIVPGGPDNWKYYDILGRLVKTETEGFGSQIITTTTTYNSDGTVANRTMQDKETAYTYKPEGRIYTKTIDGNITSYNYSARTIDVTHPDGNITSKTFDGAGRLREAEDNGGIINYEYAGCGKVDQLVYNYGKTITMGYDANGYQDWLNDPDAGYIDYDYNEIGELLSMTDPSSINTTYEYDMYGRLRYKNIPEGTITYTYNNSGFGIGQIQSVTGYNNISQNFTYDYYGRVETAYEQIQGASSILKSFTYDTYGNMLTETYDADDDGSIELIIGHEYDKGILKKVKLGSETLWQLNAMNSYGQITSYNLGSETVIKSYDAHALLTGIDYSDYSLAYDFNHTTGNLDQRYNSFSGIYEDFNYDNLNRLENVYHNDNLIQSVDYSLHGNILSKTKAGYYDYTGIQPGAVTEVSTDKTSYPTIPTDISADRQDITYTSFHKTKTVREGLYDNIIFYGPGNNRKKMTEYQWEPINTYYHGDYELHIDENGFNRRIFYISGLDGLAAILDLDGQELYYVHTDHLGSIIALRNSHSGYIDERYSYDAWGRRRNPSDYSYTGFTTNLTNRGFTGHEHLDEVGLINMNGRTYDPILGRMLSPDNNIQMPDFSQNLNRYSYVMNNPLKFTDPDGEFVLLAIGIGALIGAYIGGSAAEGWQMNPTKWAWDGDTWGGVGLGAVIGGAAGLGFFYAAPALAGSASAGTGLAGVFGTSGTVAAYTLTGGVAGGLAGYGAGLSGGMLYSNGNWGYSHQSGVYGAKIGATVGSAVGTVAGMIAGFQPPPEPESIPRQYDSEVTPDMPFTGSTANGKTYFEGTRVRANDFGSFKYGAAMTVPKIGIITGSNYIYDVNLMRHEFGHILQREVWGAFAYWTKVVPTSLYSARVNPWGHMDTWTEWKANSYSYDYFGQPGDWLKYYKLSPY